MTLTVRRVERTVRPGRYGDGGGLWLQVVNPRNRSWLFRWERDGSDHTMGLGPVHTVSLELAREKARACRLLLLDGVDPREHRDAERAARAAAKAKALIFKEAAAAYHAQHEGKWRNRKHAAQFLSTLKTYAFPVLGNMAVAAIDTPAVLRAIEPHWLTKTETMSRVRGRIEAVLDWAACAAIAAAIIRRAGKGISIRCCRDAARWPRSSTTLPSPGASCQLSWPSWRSATAPPPARWSSAS